MPTTPPQPFVYINGWPGVGKLTIARELISLLPRARLVHNHLLIDPCGAVLPRTSPAYQPLRRAVRSAVFDTLAAAPDTFGHIYVFTDFQSTDETGSAVAAEFQAAAERRGCKFVPVVVSCTVKQNVIRAGGSDRMRDGQGKLTDLNVIMDLRTREDIEIARFGGDEELVLDVTDCPPKEAARRILDHLKKVCGDDVAEQGAEVYDQNVVDVEE